MMQRKILHAHGARLKAGHVAGVIALPEMEGGLKVKRNVSVEKRRRG